ncbi:MAG: TIGR00153 family protein [Deltaproteobacteria bacterium]|nr:TIGR00153 family protein [Deltaproteobacteria bacterium]
MRIPFFSMFMTSPFEGLQKHAEKVKECAWAFQQAIECHLAEKCKTFEEFRQEVIQLETEADVIKRRIRGHLPKGTLMPVYNFLLFRYLREQDQVIDAAEDALDWISFRREPGIPAELEKEFVILADAVISPIEELSKMVVEARKYFKNYSEDQRVIIKNIIHTLRRQEHEADKAEDRVKQKALNMDIDAVTVFHVVRLAEIIGSIADHAENAGDMMRAMVAR